jgi:glucokinase
MKRSARPPSPVPPTAVGGSLVGVDVGGTKVAAIVADAEGQPRGRAVRSMSGRPAAIDPIVEAIDAALEAAQVGGNVPTAIGVGVPGRVDVATGVVRHATNLDWFDFPLGHDLAEAFGVPCAVENDVRLAAAGLLDHEAADGARSLAYVAVGTGIGAGLVLDGRLHRGERGMAGEIGHIIVEPDGVICPCGQRGCLETVASGPAIARRAAAAAATGGTTLSSRRELTAKTVYDAARAGDGVAVAIAGETGRVLARALAGLILTCDLERVLLGGGVAAAGQVFLRPILAELELMRADSPLLTELVPAGSVRLLPPHFDAVAWGGVSLARATARGTRPESKSGSASASERELADGEATNAEKPISVEEVVARETVA